MRVVAFHPPPPLSLLLLWTALSLSLTSSFIGPTTTTAEASTTVIIERTAFASSRNKNDGTDDNSTSSPNSTSPSSSCAYAGELVISQPLSVQRTDKFYSFGSRLLLSAHMTLDQINQWPNCGVSLLVNDQEEEEQGASTATAMATATAKRNYSLRLKTYGDESSAAKTEEIGREIVADNETDFLFGGYTSKLSGALAAISQEHRRIQVNPASSKPAVHEGRDYVFGVMPSNRRYLENTMRGTKAAGARTVAVAAQNDVQVCSGAPQMAQEFNMTLLDGQILTAPQVADDGSNAFEDFARNMSALNPDVMVMCIRSGVRDWTRAMRLVDWTPKALVYFLVFATKEYEQELGSDAAYTMGVTSWDSRILPPIPDGATQWTPEQFHHAYEETAFQPPVYQIASQSAAISVLAQAINRAGRLDDLEQRVKDELTVGSFPTIYGNISFDENGQSTLPYKLLQYDDDLKLHVLEPEDLAMTDFDMVYPLPTWANRDCNVLSACATTNGTCTVNGTCRCPPPLLSVGGSGATAECMPPPPEDETAADDRVQTLIAITVPVVVVIAMLVGAALFAYHHKKQQENNAVWLVKKEELIFSDPPEVIGHGTFGLVLLAEYRGTQVAVKRVLPANHHETITVSSKNNQSTAEQHTASLGSSSDDQQQGGGRHHHNGLSFHNGKTTWGGFGSGLVSTIAGTSLGNSSSRKGGGRTASTSGLWGMISGSGTGGTGGGRSRSSSKYSSKADSKKHRQRLRDDFIAEMRCVSKLRHPCITTIMGAVMTKTDEPMLIMEYMDRGSLYDILHNETMLLEGEVILSLLRDISQGCRFLHAAQPKVIHGDLRAANILVDAKFRAKVADFGLSQTSSGDRARGTPFWMAPELLRGESTNTAESDVYAFGIILYEVFSRKDPYHEDEEKSVKEVLRQVIDPEVNKRPPIPRNCPPQMAALMSDCIVGDPNERPSFSEIDMRLQRAQHGGAAAETAGGLLGTGKGSTSPGSSGDNVNGNNNKGGTVSLFDIFPKHIAQALLDGKKVEPEQRDCVTIFFCDIVGFTNISSELEPRKVADMLDRLYQKFDRLSQEHDIFKVETIGDAYMAVTNLVKDQSADHAKRIAKFACASIREANNTLIDKDSPEKGNINIRVGMHSGAVVADVVGTRNPRYCLFGDSVNVASRMESNSSPNMIHCSENSAALLSKQFPEMPLKCRGTIEVKGKGEMKTYWVNNEGSYRVNNHEGPPGGEGPTEKALLPMIQEEKQHATAPAPPISNDQQEGGDVVGMTAELISVSSETRRLISWTVEELAKILKLIAAARRNNDDSSCEATTAASSPSGDDDDGPAAIVERSTTTRPGCTVLDEVKDVIKLARHFDNVTAPRDPNSVELSDAVMTQLRQYIETIALLYRDNPFHNFEHAAHVAMSVTKLLSRIVAAASEDIIEIIDHAEEDAAKNLQASASSLWRQDDRTTSYGICFSDPLIHFSCAFSALIHDVDHCGVPNTQIIKEGAPIAAVYKNKSVAEQNSVDIAWELLMEPAFKDLRYAIYRDDQAEFDRFRQLVVNSVMATDIMDKDLNDVRNERWNEAFFSEQQAPSCSDNNNNCIIDNNDVDVDRKATIVIEHLIQASDVGHTMQHWHVYRKWNERLFREMYKAYKEGRAEKNPAEGWYQGELGFFDYYVIPLAKKLKNCGAFGGGALSGGDEYLNRAQNNREEWRKRGEEIVAEMIENINNNNNNEKNVAAAAVAGGGSSGVVSFSLPEGHGGARNDKMRDNIEAPPFGGETLFGSLQQQDESTGSTSTVEC